MSKWRYDIRCDICGRFVKANNSIWRTRYGRAGDLEPPEDEFICVTCWESFGEEEQKLIENLSWMFADKRQKKGS